MPDDHSPLEPRLPISNRTVKRWHADDSAHLARESRSLSGTPQAKARSFERAFVLLRRLTLTNPVTDKLKQTARRSFRSAIARAI